MNYKILNYILNHKKTQNRTLNIRYLDYQTEYINDLLTLRYIKIVPESMEDLTRYGDILEGKKCYYITTEGMRYIEYENEKRQNKKWVVVWNIINSSIALAALIHTMFF
jgi:hypothetical protein